MEAVYEGIHLTVETWMIKGIHNGVLLDGEYLMIRALDGNVLQTYFRRLGVSQETRDMLNLVDYYQDLEHLQAPDAELETLHSIVSAAPGLMLADLRLEAQNIPSDIINIAIARHDLYVDMNTYRLCEPGRTPVFCNRKMSLTFSHNVEGSENIGLEAHPVLIARGSKIIWDGRGWCCACASSGITGSRRRSLWMVVQSSRACILSNCWPSTE